MRTVRLEPPVRLGAMPLDSAFNLAFSEATLREVHGQSLELGEWRGDKRVVKFHVDLESVPTEVKRFVCGDRLRVTVRQTVHRGGGRCDADADADADARIEVRNRVKLHFLGAELISVRPVFEITRDAEGIACLAGRVDNVARFPPPVNGIVEAFMANNSKRELDTMRRVIEARSQSQEQGLRPLATHNPM